MNAFLRWWSSRPAPIRRTWTALALIAVPLTLEGSLLNMARRDGTLGIDMDVGLLPSAEAITDGISPFALSHYPPLMPTLLVPFTFIPSVPVLLAGLALVSVAVSLWALSVTDWRCYAAVLLWAAVFSGVQTANATLFLVCASCLAWRYRDRTWASPAPVGLAIGAKLISWPLAAWLAATGRMRATIAALAIALVSTIGLGALLELLLAGDATASSFSGIASNVVTPSYSIVDVARSLDLPDWLGLAVFGAVTLALVSLCVVLGRRGDDVRSFSVACLACLVGAPNVWLHSFAFLLPIIALRRPRFSGAWLVPALFFLVPVIDPSGAEVVGAWLLTAGLAVWLLVPDDVAHRVRQFRRPWSRTVGLERAAHRPSSG